VRDTIVNCQSKIDNQKVSPNPHLRKSRFVSSGLSSVSDLFYLQGKAGKEVDFVFLGQEGLQSIEVKYQNHVTLRDSVTITDDNAI